MNEAVSRERQALCDTFERLGPDVPTLAGDWRALDLAAHLYMREHDVLGGAGIVIPFGPFPKLTERRMESTKAKGFETLVGSLREGHPLMFRWAPDEVNLVEDFVHHEDLRRANGEGPRPEDADYERILGGALPRFSRLLLRRTPVGVEAETPRGERALKGGTPVVTLRGRASEVMLFCYGRKDAADVQLDGSPDAVSALRASRLGI